MAVTTQVLHEDATRYVVKLTNDDTTAGEAAVIKVDVSALSPAAAEVDLLRLWYSAVGQSVSLLWDANTDTLLWRIAAGTTGYLDFTEVYAGGIRNDGGAGKTGDLLLTVPAAAGGSYSLILDCKKRRTAEV